ncbi:MAG TPA: hypothetical protein VGM90_12250 [Kofleriaceae bacterium]|jgi:hypothetical protein
MRFRALAIGLAAALAGCAAGREPYRFSSPMLGMASVPAPSLDHPLVPERSDDVRSDKISRVASSRTPPSRCVDSATTKCAAAIRVANAPVIHEASAAAAAEVAIGQNAQPAERAELPAPNLLPTDAPRPDIHAPADLRRLVGYRDKRDSLVAALELAQAIGTRVSFEPVAAMTAAATDNVAPGDSLVSWAAREDRLADYTAEPQPGDLLVFDRVDSDATSDCIGLVIARDDRGVTEFLYLSNGVYRRAFVDVSRPAVRRDKEQRVVNAFMRNGKRWPAKGQHYLAGELLGHVIRASR